VVVGDRVDVEFDKYYSATVQKLKKGQFLALFADGEEVWVTMAANVGVAICDLRIEHYASWCMNVSSVLTTVALIERASRKKSIFLQTLKVGANDRSAQELQKWL
jgi:hypothetical protein